MASEFVVLGSVIMAEAGFMGTGNWGKMWQHRGKKKLFWAQRRLFPLSCVTRFSIVWLFCVRHIARRCQCSIGPQLLVGGAGWCCRCWLWFAVCWRRLDPCVLGKDLRGLWKVRSAVHSGFHEDSIVWTQLLHAGTHGKAFMAKCCHELDCYGEICSVRL